MRWPLAIEHWTRSRVATLVIAGLVGGAGGAGRRVAVRAARPGRLHSRPCRERRRSCRGGSNERPARLAGRAPRRPSPARDRPARPRARGAERRRRRDAAGRRRGARPRARRGGRRFRPRHHRAAGSRDEARARRRLRRRADRPRPRHGDGDRRGKADRGDDAETRRRHRRPPRQGRVRPRLPRRRAAARLHHQRAVADPATESSTITSAGSPISPTAASASSAKRASASAKTICASCASSVSRPATATARLDAAGFGGGDRRARGSGDPVARAGARRVDEAVRRAARRRKCSPRFAKRGCFSRWSPARPMRRASPASRRSRRRRDDAPDPLLRLGALCVLIEEDAERLRERLRLSNAETERLAILARGLADLHDGEAPPSLGALRRLLFERRRQGALDALALFHADSGAPADDWRFVRARAFLSVDAGADPADHRRRRRRARRDPRPARRRDAEEAAGVVDPRRFPARARGAGAAARRGAEAVSRACRRERQGLARDGRAVPSPRLRGEG